MLTCLLLPLALTDSRKWHWQLPKGRNVYASLVGWSSLIAIQVQMAVVYLHAATAKFGVPEWADGSAMYYWLSGSYMGLPEFLRPALEPLLASGAVGLITWSALVVEVILAGAIFMNRTLKLGALLLGVGFHLAIAVFMGIGSFSIAMCGGLVIAFYAPRLIRIKVPVTLGRLVRHSHEQEAPSARSLSHD